MSNNPFNKQIRSSNKNSHSAKIIDDIFTNGGFIIYPASDSSRKLFNIGTHIGSRFSNSRLKLIADTSVSKFELENSNIILLGAYNSNKILKSLNDELPAKFENNKFWFLNKSYSSASDLIDFVYPNPFNKQKDLIVVSGNNDNIIAKNFSFNFPGDLRIKNDFETLLIADFAADKNNEWNIDYNNFLNFENQIDTVLTTKNYTYISHSSQINKKEIDSIAAKNENSIASLKRLFGKSFKTMNINYNLYSSFEDKALIINNQSISNFEEANHSVHSVINNYVNGDDFTQDAILLLRNNFGHPKIKFLEKGMSIYLGRNWRGFDYKFWASKLYLSDNVPSLNELFDTQKSKFDSDLLIEPLAGAFIDFLIKKIGITDLMKKYSKWEPALMEVNKLNNEWQNYLLELSKHYKESIQDWRSNFKNKLPGFLKGISYAHMGYNIYNGYLSKESFNSLKRLKTIGVNAISVMPFTSMQDPNKPEPLDFWQSAFAENDESLIFLKQASVKLNFVVMLKPQIWMRHGWPGIIKMKNQKVWNYFFEDYYKWIRHYALLAEMYKIQILCIGNEFIKSTKENEEKWIKIAEQIKKLYSGKITYGANWDNEFERLNFWKHFDFIGVSEYYPLSRKDNPSDMELLAGADSVISHIKSIQEKFNLPVIFTEVGYKNSLEPWKTVYEKNIQADSTLNNQARCYEALLKASYNKKWLKGMFWWKWPSFLKYSNRQNPDLYVPLNKPAEKVLQKWFSKNWN